MLLCVCVLVPLCWGLALQQQPLQEVVPLQHLQPACSATADERTAVMSICVCLAHDVPIQAVLCKR